MTPKEHSELDRILVSLDSNPAIKKQVIADIEQLIQTSNKEARAEAVSSNNELHKLHQHNIDQVIKEARIDEVKNLLTVHSRTLKQTITDKDGDVYLDESYGYISKYEAQKRLAELKQLKQEEAK